MITMRTITVVIVVVRGAEKNYAKINNIDPTEPPRRVLGHPLRIQQRRRRRRQHRGGTITRTTPAITTALPRKNNIPRGLPNKRNRRGLYNSKAQKLPFKNHRPCPLETLSESKLNNTPTFYRIVSTILIVFPQP